jgi:uncharacterized membrane protein
MVTAPRRWPWMRIVLVVSLAFNLAVIGLVAGHVLTDGPDRRSPDSGLWRYGTAMPEPHRRSMLRTMRESRPHWEAARRDLREGRARLAAALTAEPFEPASVAAVLAEERRLIGALAVRGEGILVAQIGEMTAEERRAYAEALLAPRRRDGRPSR